MNDALIYRIDALTTSSHNLSGGYLGNPKDFLLDDGLRGLVVGSRREGETERGVLSIVVWGAKSV